MALTLITGRANSGKAGVVLDAYRDALDCGREPILVVPSSPDAERASAELVADHPVGVRVMRFDGLVEHLWDLHGDGRRIVTPTQRRVLLLDGTGSVEAGSARGLVVLAGRAIDQLASAGFGWRDMRRMPGDIADMSALLAGYAAELEARGLVEAPEAACTCAEALSSEDVISFHRFTDLTAPEISFVERAAAAGADVRVSLTWESGFPPTEALNPLVKRLAAAADIEAVPAPGTYTEPALRRIEAELFQEPDVLPETSALRFISGEGPEAEADQVAAEVTRLVAQGIAPERIVIVWRNLSAVHGTLRRALAEAGIPADIDTVVGFGETALGRAFTDAVRFLADGSRGPLLALLRSGYLSADSAKTLELESEWRRSGVTDAERLLRDVAALGPWQAVLRRLTATGDPQSVGLEEQWDELAHHMIVERHGREGRRGSKEIEDAQTHAALLRLLGDCQGLRDASLTACRLSRLLEGHTVASRVFERPGHVQVTSAERVRGRRFEAVILGGLNAGVFPAIREDALCGRALRPMFGAVGVDPPEPCGLAEERALLYGVVTRARSVLVLSRRLSDAGGDPEGPSVFWEELRDFCRTPTPADETGGAEDEAVLRFSETGLAAHATSSLRGGAREAAQALCAWEGVCEGPERLRRAHARTRQNAVELDELSLETLAARDVFSAGELETYARCPYQWFLQRQMRGRALEFEVDGLLMGSISHDALERIYAPLVRGDSAEYPVPEVAIEERARDAVVEAVGATHAPRSERDSLVAELTPRVVRSLRADTIAFPGFVPAHVEWRFGGRGQTSAPLGPYGLKGTVDRIDMRGGEAAVIDYKSGQAQKYSFAKLMASPTIQVLLYAHATRELLGVDVVAAVYRGLGDGATRGAVVSEVSEGWGVGANDRVSHDEVTIAIERAVGIGTEAAKGIRSGAIGRTGGDHCSYCPVAGWCREYVA